MTMFAKLAGTWLKGQLLMNQDTLATEEFVSAAHVILRHKSIMNFVPTDSSREFRIYNVIEEWIIPRPVS